MKQKIENSMEKICLWKCKKKKTKLWTESIPHCVPSCVHTFHILIFDNNKVKYDKKVSYQFLKSIDDGNDSRKKKDCQDFSLTKI